MSLTKIEEGIVEIEFVKLLNSKKMFTSVHVCNAVKMSGTWVKNSDVSQWLRDSAWNVIIKSNIDYNIELVSVNKSQNTAKLYYPTGSDYTKFTDTEISSMTPDEFKRIHGFDPLNISFTKQQITKLLSKKITLIDSVSTDNSGRIRIPAKIIKAIGLTPYKKVTDKKFAIKNIPDTLKVHADGRVSIPRSCTNVTKGSIKIFLKDGVIGFEKA